MGRIHKLFLFLLVISNFFALKTFSKNDQKQLFYEVNQIIIKGNEITKSKVIIRELAFKKNQQISQNEIEKKIEISNSNLTNLNLFNFITITYEIIEDKINFTIDLVERWYIWPYPIFEISERNFNVWWNDFKESDYRDFSRLNYGIFLNIENFRGLWRTKYIDRPKCNSCIEKSDTSIPHIIIRHVFFCTSSSPNNSFYSYKLQRSTESIFRRKHQKNVGRLSWLFRLTS